MKVTLISLVVALGLSAHAQTLQITRGATNVTLSTSTTTTNNSALQSSPALPASQWTNRLFFRGALVTNLPADLPAQFYRTSSYSMTVTNFFSTGSFTPYTLIPGTWQAFPALDQSQAIGAWGSIIEIDGIEWFVFVHSANDIEIRTVNTYSNSPTFSAGDPVLMISSTP